MAGATCRRTNLLGVVLVRDSKDPAGPTLAFTPDAWRSLITSLRRADLG
ncbi:DUF397 domain-containing protein [Micromonospora sp. CA-244673]